MGSGIAQLAVEAGLETVGHELELVAGGGGDASRSGTS